MKVHVYLFLTREIKVLFLIIRVMYVITLCSIDMLIPPVRAHSFFIFILLH